MDHSPGQPTKLTEEQRHRLAAMLEQHSPADVGFEARYTWTLPLVAEWIKREFGVTMSVRGISAMLGRLTFPESYCIIIFQQSAAMEIIS